MRILSHTEDAVTRSCDERIPQAHSIVFQMRVWAKASDYWPVKFDTTEKVYRELGKAGIEIPFQQIDVHVKKG